MFKKLEKAYLLGQIAFSVLVIIFGAAYGLRCLLAGQTFCAVCFAIIGYVSGYRLLFKASVKEYLQFKKAR